MPIELPWVGPLLLSASEAKRIPEGVPGIYLLHVVATRLGGYATFYVGKSNNLRRRLFQHLGRRTAKISIRAARECDTAYWSAAPVLNPEQLARIEAGLIYMLRPICNQQIPNAKPLFVDLPPISFIGTFQNEEMKND